MIKLKNIKKTSENIIECNIIPEDSAEMGYMTVDIEKEEVIECNLPRGYEWCLNHVSHARNELMKMVETDNILNEKNVVWC